MVQVDFTEDGDLFKERYPCQMSLELDGEGLVDFSAVVGGNSEEGLSSDPIVEIGQIPLGAEE